MSMATIADRIAAKYTPATAVANEAQGQGKPSVPYLGAGWALASLIVNQADEPAGEPDAIASAFAALLSNGRPATL